VLLMKLGAVIADSIIAGTALFLVGTWLSTHHIHHATNLGASHPDLKQTILVSVLGVALVTVGTNLMTDGLSARLESMRSS
jgi:hypothetical protein